MKTYFTTKQPGVLHDPLEGFSFEEGSPAHERVLAEVAAGAAEIVDGPVVVPTVQAVTKDEWLEAVIEFLGTLPNHTPKFAALWAQRESSR